MMSDVEFADEFLRKKGLWKEYIEWRKKEIIKVGFTEEEYNTYYS